MLLNKLFSQLCKRTREHVIVLMAPMHRSEEGKDMASPLKT